MKVSFTRITCDGCSKVIEVEGSAWPPPGWVDLNIERRQPHPTIRHHEIVANRVATVCGDCAEGRRVLVDDLLPSPGTETR